MPQSVPFTFKGRIVIIYRFCGTRKEELNILLDEAGVDRAQVTTLTVHTRQVTESVLMAGQRRQAQVQGSDPR